MDRWRAIIGALACGGFLLGIPGISASHDIPSTVRVQALFQAEGLRATLLIRAPLGALDGAATLFRGPGAVNLDHAEFARAAVARLWIANPFDLTENGAPRPKPELVSVRTAAAVDRSFESWERALAHLGAPSAGVAEPYYLDLRLEYPIDSERSAFSIRPRYAGTGIAVLTTLRFRAAGAEELAYEFHGDPGPVTLDPLWHEAAWRFLVAGFLHILDGSDHLLFVAALVIPFRRLRALVVITTGFTVAHSITLGAATLGFAPGGAWFPPLVEALIAASIGYMALENVLAPDLYRRWILAFAFGLVHGFGFAFALRETLQFAGSHFVTSLVAFNLGVECGQLALLVIFVSLLAVISRYVPERTGVVALSTLVGGAAAWWFLQRWMEFRSVPLPTFDAQDGARLLRWMMFAVALAALVWLADARVRRWLKDAT